MTFLVRLSLALTLLTTKVPVSQDMFAVCAIESRWFAISAELIDERERFLFAKSADFAEDIHLVRNRLDQIANAPSITEAARFLATREQVNDLIIFNRQCRAHFQKMAALYPCQGWQELYAELDSLYNAWDNLRDAKVDYYYIHIRRQALQRLREAIGEVAWQAGQMPPHVPLWRFVGVRE